MNGLFVLVLLFTLRVVGQDQNRVPADVVDLPFCVVDIAGKDVLLVTNSCGECYTNRLSSVLPAADVFAHSQTVEGMRLDRLRLVDESMADFGAYISALQKARTSEEEEALISENMRKRRQLQARVRRLTELICLVENCIDMNKRSPCR